MPKRYWLRQCDAPNFFGPYTTEEIRQKLLKGAIVFEDFVALEATGQTKEQLKEAGGWAALASMFPEGLQPSMEVGKGNRSQKSEGSSTASSNKYYLDRVRSQSSYSAARSLHQLMTNIAYGAAALVAVGSVNFLLFGNLSLGLIGLLVSLPFFVIIPIERAIFNALIDTADVVIDIGQRISDREDA